MTTTEIDPLVDLLPEGARAVAFIAEFTPIPDGDREKRRLEPDLLGPGDDRFVARATSGVESNAMLAIDRGGSLGSMLLWLLAGRQCGVRNETAQSVEALFTVGNMRRGEWQVRVEVEIPDEDDEPMGQPEDPSSGSST